MIKIDVRHDIGRLTAHLTHLQKEEIPYATSVAINACLYRIRPAVQAEMRRVFDRPTPYTLNSYVVMKGARKRSLFGVVGFKTQRIFDQFGHFTGRFTSFEDEQNNPRLAGTYLQPQMAGGPRPAKGLEQRLRQAGLLGSGEFLVPSRFMRLDQYGNVSRGTVQKILANLRAYRDPLQQTPRGGARGGKKKGEYFFTRKGVRGQRHTMIWKRLSGSGNAVPAFIVVSRAPQYRKRFDPNALAQRVVQERFALEFDTAMLKALATTRRR